MLKRCPVHYQATTKEKATPPRLWTGQPRYWKREEREPALLNTLSALNSLPQQVHGNNLGAWTCLVPD